MSYSVVLDSDRSYLVPSETGMSFVDAVNSILEYVRDASDDIQEAVFELLLEQGEDALQSFPFPVTA